MSASAVGYYGPHGDERIDEDTPPGDDFLAQVCVAWEKEAEQAETRVVLVRTGVVLDQSGGALAKMLTPFKLGAGGPVAGGKQYIPWIHVDDVVAIYLAALDDAELVRPGQRHSAGTGDERRRSARPWAGRFIGPRSRRSRASRSALYGDMAQIVTEGQRAVPRRTLDLGYSYKHPNLDASTQERDIVTAVRA